MGKLRPREHRSQVVEKLGARLCPEVHASQLDFRGGVPQGPPPMSLAQLSRGAPAEFSLTNPCQASAVPIIAANIHLAGCESAGSLSESYQFFISFQKAAHTQNFK